MEHANILLLSSLCTDKMVLIIEPALLCPQNPPLAQLSIMAFENVLWSVWSLRRP